MDNNSFIISISLLSDGQLFLPSINYLGIFIRHWHMLSNKCLIRNAPIFGISNMLPQQSM